MALPSSKNIEKQHHPEPHQLRWEKKRKLSLAFLNGERNNYERSTRL